MSTMSTEANKSHEDTDLSLEPSEQEYSTEEPYQLLFGDYDEAWDPEWAKELEKKYGIAKPYATE